MDVEGGEVDDAVLPALGKKRRLLDVDRASGANQQEGRVAVFNDVRLARAGYIDDGNRRVTDLSHTADGKRVHDDLGRFAHVHRAGHEFQGHGCRQGGQDACFYPAAQSIGENGNNAAFRLDLLGKEYVSADQLAILGPLAGINLDKALDRASHGCPRHRCHLLPRD